MAYWFVKVTLGTLLRLLFRIRVENVEAVPGDGPVILASNHLSVSDSFFLPLVLKRRVTFVAKAEYFDNWKTAWFFRAVGQIPIRREGGEAAEAALEAARGVLRSGGVFGIYPEGTRSPDGRLYKGRTGVARLAVDCGVPIVPVAMIGTRDAQPIGKIMPKFFAPITIKFGQPIRPDRFAGAGRPMLRAMTDELMYELRELSGQVYVDEYAKRALAA